MKLKNIFLQIHQILHKSKVHFRSMICVDPTTASQLHKHNGLTRDSSSVVDFWIYVAAFKLVCILYIQQNYCIYSELIGGTFCFRVKFFHLNKTTAGKTNISVKK